ncbi:hypothetical protein DQ238_15180 [Geodermatophilus sp. TF02-6]|uniref:DUF6186 family protein n=1 Tax=Geodermatophilus sp. TF02-6 TaxID=2250575 RepID=UPI000DEA5F45|nr:DUF6186 family protein [Geodermatophilus sp. TF02-6]RBY77237.1 hypothetical protein DQ238_15180 [Geodermatophilus sp. TF02-6]
MTGVLGFAVLLLAGLGLELAARRGAGPATAAQAVGAAMRTTPGRIGVLLVWLWVGVHFLAR